jgi:hypothetical protein
MQGTPINWGEEYPTITPYPLDGDNDAGEDLSEEGHERAGRDRHLQMTFKLNYSEADYPQDRGDHSGPVETESGHRH